MNGTKRVEYIKKLAKELENIIDKENCNFFYPNSYNNLICSEFKVKRYLSWRWTPSVVYIPFQYKSEEIFIINEQIIVKRLM